jgi:polysaccharide biosynthesis transport protein
MATVSKPKAKTSRNSDKRKPASKRAGKAVSRKKESDLDLLAILSRRKLIIIASAVFAALVGISYMLFMSPQYESRSRMLLMRSDAASLATRTDTANELISQDMLATHMSLIQSPRIVDKALNQAGLTELPSLMEATDGQPAIRYVLNNLYVTRGGKGNAKNSHTLTVAFRHSNPEDSKVVVDAIVKEYQEFVTTKFKDINKEAVELINTARLDLEQQITELSSAYQQFRMESPLITSEGTGGNIHEMRFQQLASEIDNVTMAIDENAGRLDLVKTGLEHFAREKKPAIEKLTLIDEKNAIRLGVLVTVERGESRSASFMASQPERAVGAQTEYTTLLTLRSQLSQKNRDFGPNHPEVKDLQLQVNEMEKFLTNRQSALGVVDDRAQLTPDDVMSAYISLLESDLLALKRRKADLEKQKEVAEADSKNLIGYELENQEHLTKINRTEALYDSVVTRLRDINMQQEATALIQEQIEEPRVGELVSPNITTAAALAMLLTFGVSACSILIAELSDKRLRSTDELEEIYQASVLGLLPNFESDDNCRELMAKTRKSKSPVAPSVIAFHAGNDPVSETIRSIRTQLIFELGDSRRLIAITSPNQGDGKTTVTANLAVSLASSGKSVLIIDCDMRRPSIHAQYGLGIENGLADVLERKIEWENAIQAGPLSGLSVMTAGHISSRPAELLSSKLFREILEALKNKYDLVILDCPPIIPVSDPAIIAPLTEGVILVTYLDEHSVPKAKHCHRVLESTGVHLIGIVVNRSKLKSEAYYQEYTGYYKEYGPS